MAVSELRLGVVSRRTQADWQIPGGLRRRGRNRYDVKTKSN